MPAFKKVLLKSITLGVVAGLCFFSGYRITSQDHKNEVISLKQSLNTQHQKHIKSLQADMEFNHTVTYNNLLNTIIVSCIEHNRVLIGENLLYCIDSTQIRPNSQNDDDVSVNKQSEYTL